MTIQPSTNPLSEQDARRLTERIRLTAHNYAEAKAKLIELVQEAKDGNAHLVLGYASWTAYLSEVLGDEPLRLARDDRQDMVRVLTAEGMSTRAIAPIVGTDNKTVWNDLKRGVENSTPVPRNAAVAKEQGAPVKVQIRSSTPDSFTAGIGAAGNTVTGLDGKTYTRLAATEPTKPKRRPIADQASDAGWELARAVERIQRIADDDRFDSNKEKVAPHMRSHLTNAIDSLQAILDRINL
ncbi:hypothetical protein [Arthrobacter woluwensis]|uniref:hypothetical protein n=1 Tax=Arthrobacter woluwensis TaxID=156980 RepID=UPI00119E7923|nr:hypothetical protein [Arthrobacter woluwensis]